MELQKIRLPCRSRKYEFKLTPIGDMHIGAAGCDEDALKRACDMIAAEENHYTILMGDHIDAVQQDDKRWDDKSIAEWLYDPACRARVAESQRDRFHDIIKRVPASRILGVHEGNHELTVRSRHYLDITLDTCRTFGLKYLGQEAFTRLIFERKRANDGSRPATSSFDIFSTHGNGGGRKPGAKVNKIMDLGGFIEADIYLMGHVHERGCIKSPLLHFDKGGNLKSRERVYVLTGTFLKTYHSSNSYGARALYPPVSIGPITITIKPDTRDVRATV